MNERNVKDMRDTNLVNALREHAEWAEGNQWETPITLGDDLSEAADRIANQSAHIAALQKEIEKLRAQLRHLGKLAEADKAGRLVVLPCKVGDKLYRVFDGNISEHEVQNMKYFARQRRLGIDMTPFFPDAGRFIGKTVFLTREEAEKALEAMKNE